VDVVLIAQIATRLVSGFAIVVLRAVVPLMLGVLSACIAGVLYAAFLGEAALGAFFSSASGVGVGVLLALIVNGVTRTQPDELDREIRAGTVALAAVGSFSALSGQLVTGSSIARGALFALTWGGITAGILGLVFFVRIEEERPSALGDALDPETLRALLGSASDSPPRQG
jgi:hypothetical protein